MVIVNVTTVISTLGKNHKCFMKKVKAAQSIVRNLVKIMIQLKIKIGVIRVEPTQRNTYFMTSKQPKTPEPTLLTSQLHKTSMVESTYTTVLRISVKAS